MSDIDPVTLEILRNRLTEVAEEMGNVLIQGAYSPNIKERQDCSTALFDASGRMIAQAEHIPVHLGALPEAVEAVRNRDPSPGDVWVLNDPFSGGNHLPDITLVSPIAVDEEIIAYGVSRAHHADVGGMVPGSMPAGATEIYQEGLRIPPVRLYRGKDTIDEDVLNLILTNIRGQRERRADLRAQLAANRRGEDRIHEIADEYGVEQLKNAFDAVIDYSRTRMQREIEKLPDGEYTAEEAMEGDGVTEDPVPIVATIRIHGDTITVNFEGTAQQVDGNINAPRAVAKSAVYFVVRAITDPDIPPNQGCYDPVTISIPEGSLLDPTPPSAVVGGNVETSQRITDVLFLSLSEPLADELPAQSQGTMNNLIIGGRQGNEFTYYETIGGGFGARPDKDGIDGVHVGMTNTLNTPVEALESEYPMHVERYMLRPDSGGDGKYRGGMGIERSITVDVPATVSLLTERRRSPPKGSAGGKPGATGENLIDGTPVGAKSTQKVDAGTTVTVRTPGGGGHGSPEQRSEDDRQNDRQDETVSTNE